MKEVQLRNDITGEHLSPIVNSDSVYINGDPDRSLTGALAEKQHVLTPGSNITIEDNVISAIGGGGGGSVDIVQTTGQSKTAVMSQWAVTTTIDTTVGNINALLETI